MALQRWASCHDLGLELIWVTATSLRIKGGWNIHNVELESHTGLVEETGVGALVFSERVCKDVGFGDKRPAMSIAAQACPIPRFSYPPHIGAAQTGDSYLFENQRWLEHPQCRT